MSKTDEALLKGLSGLTQVPTQTFDAIVLSVDAQAQSCTVDYDGIELFDVRLKSVIDNDEKSIVILPKVGSSVLISVIHNSMANCFISKYSEIDKIIIKIGSHQLEISENGIVINNGQNEGLVNIKDLVSRLNRLEDKMKQHQHIYINAAGVPTPTTPDVATNPVFVNTMQSELEDTKVKH